VQAQTEISSMPATTWKLSNSKSQQTAQSTSHTIAINIVAIMKNRSNPKTSTKKLRSNSAQIPGNKAVGPHSFADGKSEADVECPAPKDITDQVLLKPLPTSLEEVLAGLEIHEDGSLVCNDEEMLSK